MAEEQSGGVRNVWLLLIALGLGLVVVIIYNVQIHRVRMEGRGRTLRLLKLTRDMDLNDKIGDEDIEIGAVPRQFEGSLGNVVDEDRRNYVIGKVMQRGARKGQWLLWSHLTGEAGVRENPINPGSIGVTVPLDSRKSPGDLLRPNDKVNLIGVIVTGREAQTYRIIEDVRVLAVGGKAKDRATGGRIGRTAAGARLYRSVTIEITPAVSLLLNNLLTHVSGDCWLELRGTTEGRSRTAGQINPELKNLAGKAVIVERGGGPSFNDGGGAFGQE